MGKAEFTVEELVSKIEKGELRLPEMQRRYVWRGVRVRDLLDSLYRGYPSGAILVWQSEGRVPERDFAVSQTGSPTESALLLLDGQQRLTSLSAVIRGEPVQVRGRKRPIDILFNLDHSDELSVVTEVNEDNDTDEEDDEADADADEDAIEQRIAQMAFVVEAKQLASRTNWVRVTDVFKSEDNGPFLIRAGVTDFKDPRCTKYSARLNKLRAIRKYTYRVDILEKSLSYEEVTEIFVRVNSLGAKLRGSDLAMAQITAKWPESLKIFEGFQAECAKGGFDLDLGIIIKNLIAFATRQSRFKVVGNLDINLIREAWEPSREGLQYAMDFCRSNAGLSSPVLLSSPYLLIALGYYGHTHEYELTPEAESLLRYWLLLANAKGRYSRGSSETVLDQDLATIGAGRGANGLLHRARAAFGRYEIEPTDLIGRTQRSALFKTMFLAFHKAGAKDWEQSVTISPLHRGKQQKLQFHHIFPRAVLRGSYKTGEINDIANLAFIGGRTNRRISNKPPAQYLADLLTKLGPDHFRLQCIPTDRALYAVNRYPDFLEARRELIADRLNEFLGHPG
ncbi:GmrSD restriction endonuclease domain-containing protein [Nodularia spumigena]|uniref:GmrSD restriction endonuclease domain-containing protein n=1 Tax=Nodularia spumigena TaxID=70799 RepID=UPI002B21FEBA|nr:DUF262 domain-containing protein [Nodularia spumigena]MEA5615130.1 DUF262 domain-containing protein [Nodularia spumigena UHCC 0040]